MLNDPPDDVNYISITDQEVDYEQPHKYKDNYYVVPKILPHITKKVWSPCRFQGGVRTQSNFKGAVFAVLDMDESYTLRYAEKYCRKNNLLHAIAPTRNHQLPKNGEKPRDRYRLIFKFSREIRNLNTYRYNMEQLIKGWKADIKCKDGARFFYPSKEIVAYEDGKPLPVHNPPNFYFKHRERLKKTAQARFKLTGRVPRWITRFVEQGRVAGRGRNNSCYAVAYELLGYGYNQSDIIQMLLSSPFERYDFKEVEIINAVNSAARRYT